MSGFESNARLRWRRWQSRRIDDIHHALQNCHDHGFVNIDAFFQFFLKRGKFLSQLAFVTEIPGPNLRCQFGTSSSAIPGTRFET